MEITFNTKNIENLKIQEYMSKFVENIVESLIETTNNGSTTWTLHNSIFNSETSKKYECFSEDKKTRFTIDINTDVNFNFQPSSSTFWIYNDQIVNGSQLFYPSKFSNIATLGQIVFTKFVKPTLPSKNNSDAFEDIYNSMGSKQQKRDDKINQILEGSGGFLKKIFK